jgi:pimeloyl-ACP methyl ester carboxylesterase
VKRFYKRILPRLIGAYFNFLAIISRKTAARKAFTLFCTPRSGRVLETQQAFLNQAKYERVSVNEMEVQLYRWEGKGKRVLLLHGWESNAFRWRNLIGFLKNEAYEILAFDAPAHGNSSGKLFNVLRYTACTAAIVAKYKPDYIIGHSVGGMTALYHQYKYPANSLQKIVTIGSPSDLKDVMRQYQQILLFNDKVLFALDSMFKERFGFGIRDFSTAIYATEFNIPGLLIHDELDTIAPFRASEKVHKNWKNSRLISTKGLGHSMHQDEVSQHIIDFLRS